MILPWFPIVLGVGVAGRLLGRARGLGLGIICAFFWLLLTQASLGPRLWDDPLAIACLAAGMCAIVATGAWAGETPIQVEAASRVTDGVAEPSNGAAQNEEALGLGRIATAIERFEDWLEQHRNDANPWPEFDEFVRNMLYQCCRATHVKPYRLCGESEELVPLCEADPFMPERRRSARKGIVGHVLTTGRRYVAGDQSQGELLDRLADEWDTPIAWCFAVREGPRKLGVIAAGHLDVAPQGNRALFQAVERLVSRFWCALIEAGNSRDANFIDPVAGVFTRTAFLHRADQSLSESFRQGEPVALAIICLESLRVINDSGRWEAADELVRSAGAILRRKIRADDVLGRFDGSRFILLLRRVDSELAGLIVAQIVAQLDTLCDDQQRWQAQVTARCGLAGSGTEEPPLRSLVMRSLMQCARARVECISMATDMQPVGASAEAST